MAFFKWLILAICAASWAAAALVIPGGFRQQKGDAIWRHRIPLTSRTLVIRESHGPFYVIVGGSIAITAASAFALHGMEQRGARG